MNTVVTLNLTRVVRAGAPLPAYAVVDLIPVAEGQTEGWGQVSGVVLELRNTQKLRTRVPVPAGLLVVNVKFPNGALLTQQVEVSGSEPSISFALSGRNKSTTRPTGMNTREVVGRYQIPARSKQSADRAAGGVQDRSRWRAQAVQPRADNRQAPVWTMLDKIAREVVNERQANLGIARLKSSERSALGFAGEGQHAHLDPRAIIGTASAIQPIKLYGDLDSLTTQWKLPLRHEPRARYSREDEGRFERYFAVAYKVGKKTFPEQIACIPGRWRRGDDTLAKVHANYDRTALRTQRESRIRIEVDDPEYSALLEYLQTGDIESSVALFAKAKEGLRQKFLNPYAAAAGGYVLLYSGTIQDAEYWADWIFNLANHFTALPDGSLLLATMLLQSPVGRMRRGLSKDERHSIALNAAMEAVRRGPPLYRLGLALLASNLRILNGAYHGDGNVVHRIEQAQDYVQALSLRADPTQPFSVFDVATDVTD